MKPGVIPRNALLQNVQDNYPVRLGHKSIIFVCIDIYSTDSKICLF